MLEGTSDSRKKLTAPFAAERDLHEKRWRDKADADAARGKLSRAWRGERLFPKESEKKTWEDLMRAEAEHDNVEFDKRHILEKSKKEFEAWQVLLHRVIEGFKQRVADPDDTDNGTLIIMWPGGMKGAYTAGRAVGLQKMGMKGKVVDMVIGTSTGAVVATPFVEGTEALLKSTTMMIEELASEDFINPYSPMRWMKRNVIRLQKIKELWTEGEYKIDEGAIKKSPTDLIYTVTEPMKGDEEPKVKYLDAKTIKPGMIDGVIASMSILLMTGKIPKIDGKTYNDGGFGLKNIEDDIAEFTRRRGKPPKNVLILPTTPFETLEEMKPSKGEIKIAQFVRRQAEKMVKAGSSVRAGSLYQAERGLLLKGELRKSVELIRKQTGINVAIMWDWDEDVSFVDIDGDKMRSAYLSSGRDVYKQWGAEQPEEFPYYVSNKQKLKNAINDFKQAA